jgi:ATPase subunit of ABC transporter with duplicated ATPase domains
MYKRAKELEKRMEKIEVLDRPILSKRKIRLDKNSAGRSGKIVIEAIDLGKTFDDRVLLKNAGLNVFYQDSVCIIGENGCGKSTLLKMILGETELGEGAVKIGSQVIIGYLPQQIEFPDEEQTVLEYFAGTHNIPYGEARSQLAKVLFLQEDVNKKIKFLSGGEKSRLRLCSLTFDGVNLLVLDEPTNHLDIDSREVLEETLLNFDGTLLFVSHDRYFINKVADKIVVLENCRTREYDGDYTYYQNERKKEEENQKAALNSRIVGNDNGSNSTKRKDTASSASWKEKNVPAGKKNARKLELLEQRIEMMEEQVKDLELQMEIYNSDSARLKEFFEEKEKLADELMQAYTEWDMLQE